MQLAIEPPAMHTLASARRDEHHPINPSVRREPLLTGTPKSVNAVVPGDEIVVTVGDRHA